MKRILQTIFDPPWWFVLLGWPVMFVALIFYAWPSSMDGYVDNAATPQMKLALVREIRGSEQRVVLEFASQMLQRISRFALDESSMDSIDKALEEIQARIDRGYVPPKPKAAEKKPETAENKPEARAKTAEAEDKDSGADAPTSADKKRPLSRAERRALEKLKRSNRFGIEIRDKDDIHINLGLLSDYQARSLESKYGAEVLPHVDQLVKDEIYSGVKRRGRNFLAGTVSILMLILLFPLVILSKIVAAIIRMFSSKAETSLKVAEENALARQLTEARLAAMQAQIEPHFLFNTMASVQQLIVTDPPAAAKMQADLIKYLRAAIPQMREAKSTLSREAELSRAYLDILKIRMEDRLAYVIDISDALGAESFPPMMLPTLVENAIKHGLEPRTEGGEIRISASAGGGKLRVSVTDTGMGFSEQAGQGVGLANVRERLTAMYGRQAQLIVEPNLPRGAIVTIEIPYAGGATS